MGDHRISYKIEFSMHGVEDKADAWLNWNDDLPDQIAEWFRRNHGKAMANWNDESFSEDERRAQVDRNRELAELARLKAKYEAR